MGCGCGSVLRKQPFFLLMALRKEIVTLGFEIVTRATLSLPSALVQSNCSFADQHIREDADAGVVTDVLLPGWG